MNWVGSPNTRSSKTSWPPPGLGTNAIPTATRTEPRGPAIEGGAPVAPARGCPQPQQHRPRNAARGFRDPTPCKPAAAGGRRPPGGRPRRRSTAHGTLPEYSETHPLANLLRLGTAALRACAVAALTAQTCGFPKRSQCPTVFFQIQARDEG